MSHLRTWQTSLPRSSQRKLRKSGVSYHKLRVWMSPYHPPSGTFEAFTPTTEEELKRIISCSPSSSCSLDPIPTWLLKGTSDATLLHLVNFINLSLAQGTVPQNLTQALVRPLIKKPSLNSNELKNYRPVSNLSYVSKLLEGVVAHRPNNHMQEYGLHEPLQSVYKPGHSTEIALLRVHYDILTNMDGQSVTMLIMLDLSAAFDTIDHRVLLDHMESTIGVTVVPLTWFVSYVSQRSQSVQINQVVSMLSILLLFSVPTLSDLHSPSRSYHSLFRLQTSHICR